MRKPTPPNIAYAWHAKALLANGIKSMMPPIYENEPKPGWYMRRVVKEGPYVPARIWLETEVGDDGELLAPERLLCEVDGKLANVASQWTWLASRPISEDRYMDMIAGNFTTSEPDPYADQTINGEAFDETGAPEPAQKTEAKPPGKTLF